MISPSASIYWVTTVLGVTLISQSSGSDSSFFIEFYKEGNSQPDSMVQYFSLLLLLSTDPILYMVVSFSAKFIASCLQMFQLLFNFCSVFTL